jgi:hypothetical protein
MLGLRGIPLTARKPAPEAYRSVAAALNVDAGDICLIASHVWDTIGAGAADWQAGLILREGNAPIAVGPQPDYVGKDLDAIADQLIEVTRPTPASQADANRGPLTQDALSASPGYRSSLSGLR